MFYMGAALIASETPQEKVQHFEAAKCLSWCKLSVYMFFLYELWHHYNDIFYIFLIEHWNGWTVFLLLVGFWVPLCIPLNHAL